MVATRLNGERFLDEVVSRLREQIAAAGHPAVCLATVLASDDPRDLANAHRKHRAAAAAGMAFRHLQFPGTATQREVESGIDELVRDTGVHGIFVQFPLPPQLDAGAIMHRIPPRKNVDGPIPAAPAGIVRILERYAIPAGGMRAVVVGESLDIAKPLAQILRERGNDVTLVAAGEPHLETLTRTADILAAAAEKPHSITAAHVKPGATVIDAGYNRTPDGVAGDVDLESVERVAGAVLPMPGGIGPLTIAMLLERTWEAAR